MRRKATDGWYSPETHGRDECAYERKRQDDPEIPKKVFLEDRDIALVRSCSCAEQGVCRLACFSSYPELRMMGGSSRLKKSVCLKVWQRPRARPA